MREAPFPGFSGPKVDKTAFLHPFHAYFTLGFKPDKQACDRKHSPRRYKESTKNTTIRSYTTFEISPIYLNLNDI